MIAAFNALQFVILFACLPFLIAWLHTADIPFQRAALILSVVIYLIMFAMTWLFTVNSFDKDSDWF